MNSRPLKSPDSDDQLDSDPEMNERDSIEDNMSESDKTEQEGTDHLVNAFEGLKVPEDSDSNRESLTCQSAKVELLPVGQTDGIDDTDRVQVPQEFLDNSEIAENDALKTKDCIDSNSRNIDDVKIEKAENDDSTKILATIPDLRSCGCSPPCVFSPPGLPEIETKSPRQLLKIMTLLPCWKRDNKFITDLLLVSQCDLSVPIPGEQFFRAVARCSNIREFIKGIPGWTEAFFKLTEGILRERGINVSEKKSSSTFGNSDLETEADYSDNEQMDETKDAVDVEDSITGVSTEMDIHSDSQHSNLSHLTIDEANIRVLLQNVRGCRKLGKMKELCFKFLSDKYNIFVVTESHLSPDVPSSLFNSFGVSILRCDRNSEYNKVTIKSGRSGGVAILYKPGICITEIPIKFYQHYGGHRCEMLACRVSLPSGKCEPFTLVAVYRPPDTTANEVGKLIEHLKSFIPDSRCKLVGDFNFNKERTTPGAPAFFEFIEDRKMTETVEKPTRIVISYPDLVFNSSDLEKEEANVFGSFVPSDHKSISFSFSLTPISTVPFPNPESTSNLKPKKDQTEFSLTSFLTERRHSFSSNTIPNSVPLRRVKSCFDVSTLVDDVVNVNWKKVFLRSSSSLQKYEAFFAKMSTIVSRHKPLKPQTRTTEKMKVQNVHDGAITISKESEKAVYFGNYFSANVQEQESDTESTQTSTRCERLGISKIFSHDVVQRTLEALPKSSDPYLFLLNNEFLRQCATPLAKPLAFIFKELLRETTVPDSWKKSVGVVFNAEKKPEQNIQYKSEPLADVMEQILCNYLKKSNKYLFSPFGNEVGHPDETFYTANDKKLVVVEFLVHGPLSKISKQQLINNAEKFGIHQIFSKWFDKFLSHRKFCVKVNDYIDREKYYPLFFTTSFKSFSADLFAYIYINPLLLGFPRQVPCSFCSFTGMVKFWTHSIVDIQTGINYIETWCEKNPSVRFKLVPDHRGPSTVSMTFTIDNIPVVIQGKTRPKTPS